MLEDTFLDWKVSGFESYLGNIPPEHLHESIVLRLVYWRFWNPKWVKADIDA